MRVTVRAEVRIKCSLCSSGSVWCDLIATLASPSPVCATIHPSEKLFDVLKMMASDERCIHENVDTMQYLQTQVPVLFYLLQHLKYIPHKVLNPLLHELINKADAPFLCCSTSTDSDSSVSDFDELSFFPNLQQIRCRPAYAADRSTRSKICTKKGGRHPTLLPGVFTIFCQHGDFILNYIHNNHKIINDCLFQGICYGFETMKVSESPNTAFTILFTRFRKGVLSSVCTCMCVCMCRGLVVRISVL